MTADNPYDVNYPGKFDIEYVGFADEFYCFRLKFQNKPGFDACMFQMEMSQWLFESTQDKWFMGNQFPYPDHPQVTLVNTGNHDYFVLLRSLADVAQFEHAFPVHGLTPTMLV